MKKLETIAVYGSVIIMYLHGLEYVLKPLELPNVSKFILLLVMVPVGMYSWCSILKRRWK